MRVQRTVRALGVVTALAAMSVPVAQAADAPASATLGAAPLGVNTNSGDRRFSDAVVPGLLHDAGVGIVRYPGGGGADNFNWHTGGSADLAGVHEHDPGGRRGALHQRQLRRRERRPARWLRTG